MNDCIRYCGICGREISYVECINISVLSENISVDVHKHCFITISDILKIQDIILS